MLRALETKPLHVYTERAKPRKMLESYLIFTFR